MPIRITGLNSGLDTETIISALVSSYNYKAQKYKKAQTKLSWKQDAWKALNLKIKSLYDSVGSLRFSTAYNLKKTTVSDATKASVSASGDAPTGTQKLNILEVAQAAYLTGGKLDDTVTGSSTLAELGYTGGDGKITVTKGDGSTKEITVSQGTTVSQFVNQLKEAGLTANYDATNKRIYVSAKETGKINDFTLTGSNVDGINALTALGLNVESPETTAVYESYMKYYDVDGGVVEQNVKDAIKKYQEALKTYNESKARNGNLTSAYGYASAYSAMMDAMNKSGLSKADQERMQELLGMSATERANTVKGADGNLYTEKYKDADNNLIYSYKDENGNEKLLKRVDTYSDGAQSYTKNADGSFTGVDDGKQYVATDEKDTQGNTIYKEKGNPDGIGVAIKTNSSYYEASAKATDADGNEYTLTNGKYQGADGKIYRLDGTKLIEVNADGTDKEGGATVATKEVTYTQGAASAGSIRLTDELSDLRGKATTPFTDEEWNALSSNVSAVKAYESAADDVLDAADPYSRESIEQAVKDAYENGYGGKTGAEAVKAYVETFADQIAANKTQMEDAQGTMDEHKALAGIASMDVSDPEGQAAFDAAVQDFVDKVKNVNDITSSSQSSYNTDAKKVAGTDSRIELNGIEYTSSKNTYSINGLNINALQVTGPGDDNAVTITTSTDTQGIYDKVKDFLTQYNALINEMTALYNAENSKGYEPLSDEERDAMSDTDIEKWEAKIKDSLLRRDDTLQSVMSAMQTAMSKGYEYNGQTYYLSSFGIKTLSYFVAPQNQGNAYHIDGDADDSYTSGNDDKLMEMINSDPDAVVSFMQQLTNDLYSAVGKKMQATTLSSSWTVYNDKEMAAEYSDYTDLIKKWEDKLQEKEDYWYNKFAAMEKALGTLNSQSSGLSGLMG